MDAGIANLVYWLAMLALILTPLFAFAQIAKESRPMWIVDVQGVDGGAVAQHHFATKNEALQFLANCGAASHASAPYHRETASRLSKIIAAEAAMDEIEAGRLQVFSTPKPY